LVADQKKWYARNENVSWQIKILLPIRKEKTASTSNLEKVVL